MWINYVHFYVEDAHYWRDWFVENMGFQAIATVDGRETAREIITINQVTFVLSSPKTLHSEVYDYLIKHPAGVADLAFTVPNLEPVIDKALLKKVEFTEPLQVYDSSQGKFRWCQLSTPVGFKHTLVESKIPQTIIPLAQLSQINTKSFRDHLFTHIDHLVLNVEKGKLTQMISWYEHILGLQPQQNFQIGTNLTALTSQVMIHPETGIQLPINESVDNNSQIQEFIDFNGGAGIQHIALSTAQIIDSVQYLQSGEIKFLNIPNSYYQNLPRLDLSALEYQQLQQLGILIEPQKPRDREAQSLLLQIFTQPIFSKPTFFFEIIERRHQAVGFGTGNFQALFEAMEREQFRRKNGMF